MSTTTEAPSVGTSLGEAAKTSKQIGLVSMEQRMAEALKKGNAEPIKAEPEPETKVDKVITSKLTEMIEAKEEPKKVESPKAADWKKVNEDRETLRKEKEELAKKLAELETASIKPERVQELETQLSKVQKELELKAYERSETFQSKYAKPIENLTEQLREYVKVLELDPSVVDQAIALHGKQRLEFIDEHFGGSTSGVAAISQALFQLDGLNREKEQALSINHEQLKSVLAEEDAKRNGNVQAENEAIMKAFEARRGWASEKLPHFRQNGDETHNKQVQENFELAKSLIAGTADPEDIAAAPYLAVAARSAFKRAETLEKENFDLKARLAEYTANEPELGTGDKTTSNSGKPMGILQKMGIRG